MIIYVLYYKFKKELLENGNIVLRPRILIRLTGSTTSIESAALIDTGADVTVIPEGIAKAIGLDMSGEKGKLYAYHESCEVVSGTVGITFIGKANRENVHLKIPVLITISKEGYEDDQDIVLGVNGIFDNFDITFRKSANRIILKRVTQQR